MKTEAVFDNTEKHSTLKRIKTRHKQKEDTITLQLQNRKINNRTLTNHKINKSICNLYGLEFEGEAEND